MKNRLWIVILALASAGAFSCADESGSGSNNDSNGATSANASTANVDPNGDGGPTPSWDLCTDGSQFDMEVVAENGISDPFADLPLGYARAYFSPIGNQVAFIFLRSESDDLEDAADFDTIFLRFSNAGQAPSGEFEVPPGIFNQVHNIFAQVKGGTPGLDSPQFETRSATIRWTSDEFGVGSVVTGEIDLVVGTRCASTPGEVTYRITFETIWRNIDDRESEPCGQEQIEGEWNDYSQIGDLELLFNGVLFQPVSSEVFVNADNWFYLLAGGDGNNVRIEADASTEGQVALNYGLVQYNGCTYDAEGETVTLQTGESGTFQEGPSTGLFELNLLSPIDGCPPLDLRATYTFGVCPEIGRF